jgi:hypothetical protein
VSKYRAMLGVLVVAAIIIIAMAVYIFTHYNSMALIQEFVIIAIALILLFVIMGVLVMIVRSADRK